MEYIVIFCVYIQIKFLEENINYMLSHCQTSPAPPPMKNSGCAPAVENSFHYVLSSTPGSPTPSFPLK
jgi:hypothetical protein